MKQNRNKILLIALVLLVAVFLGTKLFRAPALKTNLDVNRFAIDTALITSIKLDRPGKPQLTLERSAGSWIVKEGDKQAKVESFQFESLMRTLTSTKPERIVSRSTDKWATYEVSDSTSLRMVAYDADNEPVIDWHVGRQAQGATYVRADGENETYAMEGNIRADLDNDFNRWRDKTFIRTEPSIINKITFTYPADSGFVLQKDGSAWTIENQRADSAQVERYLSRFRLRKLSSFVDEPPSQDPDVTLTIETSKGDKQEISGWKNDEDSWTLNSTVQPDAYFRDTRTDNDLFVGKETLLAK
mgnify:CR=1 FL=1|jgi:hypothetical protein